MTTAELAAALLALPEKFKIVQWANQQNKMCTFRGLLHIGHDDGDFMYYDGEQWHQITYST